MPMTLIPQNPTSNSTQDRQAKLDRLAEAMFDLARDFLHRQKANSVLAHAGPIAQKHREGDACKSQGCITPTQCNALRALLRVACVLQLSFTIEQRIRQWSWNTRESSTNTKDAVFAALLGGNEGWSMEDIIGAAGIRVGENRKMVNMYMVLHKELGDVDSKSGAPNYVTEWDLIDSTAETLVDLLPEGNKVVNGGHLAKITGYNISGQQTALHLAECCEHYRPASSHLYSFLEGRHAIDEWWTFVSQKGVSLTELEFVPWQVADNGLLAHTCQIIRDWVHSQCPVAIFQKTSISIDADGKMRMQTLLGRLNTMIHLHGFHGMAALAKLLKFASTSVALSESPPDSSWLHARYSMARAIAESYGLDGTTEEIAEIMEFIDDAGDAPFPGKHNIEPLVLYNVHKSVEIDYAVTLNAALFLLNNDSCLHQKWLKKTRGKQPCTWREAFAALGVDNLFEAKQGALDAFWRLIEYAIGARPYSSTFHTLTLSIFASAAASSRDGLSSDLNPVMSACVRYARHQHTLTTWNEKWNVLHNIANCKEAQISELETENKKLKESLDSHSAALHAFQEKLSTTQETLSTTIHKATAREAEIREKNTRITCATDLLTKYANTLAQISQSLGEVGRDLLESVTSTESTSPTGVQGKLAIPLETCPISLEPMADDAVISPDGNTYSKEAIQECIDYGLPDPFTEKPIATVGYPPNRAYAALVESINLALAQFATQPCPRDTNKNFKKRLKRQLARVKQVKEKAEAVIGMCTAGACVPK